MTDPRSECLEWIRAQADARAANGESLRDRRRRALKKAQRRERRRQARLARMVSGLHPGTGLWIGRVDQQDHVTLRAYGVASAAGVFAAVALVRTEVERLHRRLGNILDQWPKENR